MTEKRRMRRRPDAGFVDEHLGTAELAERIGVCKVTIYREVALGCRTKGREGIYPVRRMGRRILIPATSANGWLRRMPVVRTMKSVQAEKAEASTMPPA